MKMRRSNASPKSILSNSSGFTLLEIIAVIVILSIIAVVAVPRYFDLQEQARQKTVLTALAEAIGRVNGHFAEALLSGSMPWQVDLRDDVLGSDLGDFTLETDDNAAQPGDSKDDVSSEFQITVRGKDHTALEGISATTLLPRPGM
jgi:prepilin-type N-terminal cleavage/methylation domain-containing protein